MSEYNPYEYSYVEKLIGRIWKIIPLTQEGNEEIATYISSLIFEIKGMVYHEKYYEHTATIESVIHTLESILDSIITNESNFSEIKREVFKCTNSVDRQILKGDKNGLS